MTTIIKNFTPAKTCWQCRFLTDDEWRCLAANHHIYKSDNPKPSWCPIVEQKHGRWILDENPHDGDCRCSVCRVAIDAMNERNHEMLNILTGGKWWTFYHYCPNCGAKMDGDTE